MARIARLGVVIDSSGAKKGADETTQALRGIEQTAQRTVSTLQKAGAAIGITFAVGKLQETIDKYASLDARLRQVTGSSTAAAAAQQQLVRIANDTRQSYSATIDVFARLARNADQLGLSQRDLVEVTEAVANATRLSSASSASAEAALMQLGQAMASGVLRGQELNSIMEQLPELARAIADGLGVPIGKLREMGEAGELTADKVARALQSQREELAATARQIPATIGQAIQQLTDEFGRLVNGANQTSGASMALVGAISALSGAMGPLLTGATAVGAVFGARWMAGAAQQAQDFATGLSKARAETLAYAEDAVRTAQAQRAASAQRIAQLQQEQAEVRAAAAAERERLAVANARVARAVPAESLGALGGRVAARDNAEVAFAIKQAADSQAALNALQTQGISINAALSAEKEALAVAETAVTTATTANAAATSLSARAAQAATTAYTAFGGAIGVATLGVGLIAQQVFSELARKEREAADEMQKFNEAAKGLSPAARLAAIRTELELQERLAASLPKTAAEWRALSRDELWAADAAKRASQERVKAIKAISDAEDELRRKQAAATPGKLAAEIDNARAKLEAFRRGGALAAEAFEKANREWTDATGKNRTLAQALREGDAAAQGLVAQSRELAKVNQEFTNATQASTRAQKDAKKSAEELAKALEEVAFDGGTARKAALDNVNALRDLALKGAAPASIAVQQLIMAQERAAAAAAAQANAVKLGIADTAAYRAEVMTATQVEELRNKGIRLTVEQLDRLRQANLALAQAQDASQKDIKKAADQFGVWDDAIQGVATTLRDLSGALNGTGGDAVKMLGLLAGALDGLAKAQKRAREMAKANEKLTTTQKSAAVVGGAVGAFGSGYAVGSMTTSKTTGLLGGAAAGAATGAAAGSVIPGVGTAIGAIIGGMIGSIGGLLAASKNATQQLIAQKAAQEQLSEAMAAMRATFEGDALAQAVAQTKAQFSQLRQQTEAAFSGKKNESERNRVLAELNVLEARRLELLKQQFEEAMRLAMGDLEVRRLRAKGADLEATRLAESLAGQREINEAIEKYGKDSPYVASLREVIKLEQEAAEATRARLEQGKALEQRQQREAFGLDLTARRQTLAGDDRGAFQTRLTIQNNSALAEAQKLVEAGVITAEMFEELRRILGEEMVDALEAFDQAAEEAKLQTQEDLAVRALIAQGRTEEAKTLRREIANRRELAGVTDEAVRAQILYVQGLEEAAEALEAAAELERNRNQQNADIDRRMITALKTLDPARARQIEQTRKEIERAQELANAVDDSTRARLRELYATEDAAEAIAKLTEELDAQKKAAEELASFTSSLNVQYLRSQGRNFEAAVAQLNEWRTEQIKKAQQLGAGQEALDQIQAIYTSRYNELVAEQMGSNKTQPVQTPELTPSRMGEDSVTVLGEDSTAMRSARSITEATALQLVDYAASQTALLRRLVQIAEGGSGATGDVLAAPSLDGVDRLLGVRVNDASRLLAGRVR